MITSDTTNQRQATAVIASLPVLLETMEFKLSVTDRTQEQLCLNGTNSTNNSNNDSSYCEKVFDGLLCWEKTTAGKRAFMPCPFNADALAFKDCLPNGTWYSYPISSASWYNYASCLGDLHFYEITASVFIWGHVISIAALTLSMVIFSYFSQLNCARVTIHKNLFVTYILSGSVWITEIGAIVSNSTVLLDNPLWCRVVHILTQYMTTCNYFWMCCEGLFMYMIFVQTFVNERYLLKVCFFLGWAVPILPTLIYVVIRHLYGDNSRCWTGKNRLHWIIQVPVVLSLLGSFILSINIMKVLISKLRATNTNHYHKMRRSIRAILFLIPTLGLHFLMMPLRSANNSHAKYIYDIISAIFISFQGFFVAFLLCFLNEEVISVVKRKISQCMLHGPDRNSRQSDIASVLIIKKPVTQV